MGARVDPSLALSTALPVWIKQQQKPCALRSNLLLAFSYRAAVAWRDAGAACLCGGTVVAEIVFQDICYPLLDFAARRGSDGRGAVSASHAC